MNRRIWAKRILARLLVALVAALPWFTSPFASPAYSQTNPIRFENISTEQGLSQSTVNAILQDGQGYLWFGTEGGLNKYDGYSFTVYKHDPDDPKSLADNIIDSVFEDRSGGIWVGTANGLDRYDPKTGAFVHAQQVFLGSDNLSGKTVHSILQDRFGTLWAGTEGGGLDQLDLAGNRLTEYKHDPESPQSVSDNTILSIYEDRSGEVWIGTQGGLDRFDRDTGAFAHVSLNVPGSPITARPQVYAIDEDNQNALWVGTEEGLIRWDRTSDRMVAFLHDPSVADSLSDNSIRSVYEDSEGVLWIGTRSGLDQYDGVRGSFVRYLHNPDDPHSLVSNSIRSVLEDRSGVVWVGTSDGGLSKYARATQMFALYRYNPGLPNSLNDNNIWSVYEDPAGTLWVGTFFSGLDRLDRVSGAVTVYQHDPSDPSTISDDEIRAIVEDRSGTLWIGTERGGLNRFNPTTGTFAHYLHDAADPGSLSGNGVFSIFQDTQGLMWVGTLNNGLNQFDPTTGTFVHYLHDPNDPTTLSNNDVRAIYEDHGGSLWIATFGGVDLWTGQGNRFTTFRHDPGNPSSLSSDMVICVLEDAGGTIWFGTFGGGLNRFDRRSQSFTHYTTKNGLADDTVYGILADSNGSLWLSTNAGLSRLNPQDGTFRNYDVSDGLQGDQFNPGAYFQAQSGQMFFGGTAGLNAFFPQQVRENTIPPQMAITSFKIFNQTVPVDLTASGPVRLSYQDNFISFEFAALDYNAPEKNQYAYQLVGVDKDWVYAGSRRYASYTNLAAGDYIFRVKGSNNDGIWNSEGISLSIHIAPPFWQTWWFLGLVGLTLAGAGVGAYRLRVRDMEALNRELVKRVERRTHELAALHAIAAAVNRSLDLREILKEALDKTLEVMRMEMGLAFRLDEGATGSTEGPRLTLLAQRGLTDEFVQVVRSLPLQATVIGSVADPSKPVVHQGSEHPNPRIREANDREGIATAISVPLLVKGRLVGDLMVAAHQKRQVTADELSLLASIGQEVGMAVENARLYEQAEQAAVMTERSRLARELHDSVTQLLYSVTLYAEAAAQLLGSGQTITAAEHLRELRDTAQEALRETRLLIFELHRPDIGKGGLVAALQARLEAVESRGGMHADLHSQGVERLPRPLQEELYNIAQEALNNALKHAHAKSVHIGLRFEETATVLEISDDGVGFEPATERQQGGGFGISGMRERAEKIGGTLEIDAASGRGTRVFVRVPLKASELSFPKAS